ncbi:hypothetical protein Hdeb2414_s0017g00510551 [Helianthus debilis subsp. tardiflorus]
MMGRRESGGAAEVLGSDGGSAGSSWVCFGCRNLVGSWSTQFVLGQTHDSGDLVVVMAAVMGCS